MSIFCEGCGADLGDGRNVAQNEEGEFLCDGCYDDYMDDVGRQPYEDERDYDSDYYMIDGVGFADPGGRSALRAATKDNPRNLPCPSCGRPNLLTPLDVRRHYVCDRCADAAEGIGGYGEGEY